MNKRRLVFLLLFFSLSLVGLTGCLINIDTGASLTIANNTTFAMDYVSWTDGDGTTHYFGTDNVYDSIEGVYTKGLFPGHADTHSVTPGSGYLYFYDANSLNRYRTAELISVGSFERKYFSVDSSTPLNVLP